MASIVCLKIIQKQHCLALNPPPPTHPPNGFLKNVSSIEMYLLQRKLPSKSPAVLGLKYEISWYLDKRILPIKLQKAFVSCSTNIFNCKGDEVTSTYRDDYCWSSENVRYGRLQNTSPKNEPRRFQKIYYQMI